MEPLLLMKPLRGFDNVPNYASIICITSPWFW